MAEFVKDISLASISFPFGMVQVNFPPKEAWNENAFRALVQKEIDALKKKYTEYDRKAVFGENPYVKFFKKFKKTYPVMLQFESVVLKDRPFPAFNPIAELAFLTEITTFVLSGAHDTDQFDGDVQLYIASSREDFEGLREILHTYPNDFCAKDNSGIIFSLIAGTDKRTSATPDSRNVIFPLFGTPDLDTAVLEAAMEKLTEYVRTLAPAADIHCRII